MMDFNPGGMGGIETYIRNLFSALLKCHSEETYTLVCSEANAGNFPIVEGTSSTITFDNRRGALSRFMRSALRKTCNIDLVKRRIDNLGLDVVHNPFTNIRPLGLRTPTAVTFYDLQHEYCPQYFPPRELERRKFKYRAAAHQATRIMAISDFTRQSLVERYAVPADRIDVVHLSCGSEYRESCDPEQLQKIREKYGLERPFLYYPAATWPHKNHRTLLAALQLLHERHGFNGELVLTGIAMHSHNEILGEIERRGLKDKVKVLGYLPYEDLPYLYKLARIMVFPSLFEGFGIPLVEAMACGCPVVCSDVTSMPEVVGEAAVTFDPNSWEEMADKIWRVWDDDSQIEKMRECGLARADLFSWEKTARQTLDVYRHAAEGF
jgi:glycosyltransferase involved in cell wall biosynthesis